MRKVKRNEKNDYNDCNVRVFYRQLWGETRDEFVAASCHIHPLFRAFCWYFIRNQT